MGQGCDKDAELPAGQHDNWGAFKPVSMPGSQSQMRELYLIHQEWVGHQSLSPSVVPTLFWHQGPVLWKRVWGWFKHITFKLTPCWVAWFLQAMDQYQSEAQKSWGSLPQVTLIYKERPKKQNLLIKMCILTRLNWSHLQSAPHWTHYTCQDVFRTAFELVNFDASAVFCFTFSTSAKCFLSRTFSTQGNFLKSHLGQDWVNREGGVQRSRHFWSKTAQHSTWCGQMCS